MSKRKSKGLSPLVAAVLLISATVVGGMLVYNYFQSTMDKLATSTEGLQVNARSAPVSGGKLVYIEVSSMLNEQASISQIVFLDGNGTTIPNSTISINKTINPNEKITLIEQAPLQANYFYLVYTVNGETMVTEPIAIG